MKDNGTILVLDDTPADLELLVDTLTAQGYQVLPADNGELALAAVAARLPELILLDIRLPGLDGFEVCRRLKARPESRDIPIMFISVSGERAERVEGLRLGAVDYLTKPFEREDLLARVHTHLELRRLRVRLERQAAELRQANEQLQSELAERKRTAAALRQSEEQLRAMFDLASVGIAQADPHTGQWLRVNQKMCEITGYTAGELLQMRVPDITYPEDRQCDWGAFERVVRGEAPNYRMEKRYIRKDGALVWVNVNMTILRDAAGQPTRTVAAIEDITERKRAEEVLRQRVKLQDQLVHTAAAVPGMIYTLLLRPDGSTRMPYASGALSDIFDLQPKDIIEDAAPVFSLIHPDDIGHVLATIAESARTLNPWRDDFRVCHTRLGEIWVEGHSVPQREPDGSILWHGFVQDITKRKESEIALIRLAAIIESSDDAIIGRDLNSLITSWNKGAEKLFGYTASEMIRTSIVRLLPADRQEEENQVLGKITRGESVGHFETLRQGKDGRLIEVSVTASPIKDATGKVIGVSKVVRDITERKRAEEALRASQQLIEGILNVMPVRVFWKDKNLVYLGCNAVFARDAGFDNPKDIIGKGDCQMGWRDQAELYRGDDRQVIESGRSKFLIEEPQTTPEGNTITLLSSKVPLRGANGEITGVLGTYMDITARKQTEAERDQLIQDLQKALASVKSLSGLLPICAGCKQIRDDQGYWSQVESYVQKHSEATFTHGLCPDCIKKYYPDLDEAAPQAQ